MRDWDPLNVKEEKIDDEYDACLGPLYRLVLQGAPEKRIVEELERLEDWLGISVRNEVRHTVARALLSLGLSGDKATAR